MDGTGRLGLGVTAVAAVAALAWPTTTSAPTEHVRADPRVSPAALTSYADCAELLRTRVAAALPLVGPYGWQTGDRWPTAREATLDTATAGTPADAVGTGPTGTTTQETGVDEPDVAKTDGRLVVRLDQQQRRVLVTDVSGPRPRELSAWTLPRSTYAEGLLLVDGHVLVTSQTSAGFATGLATGMAGGLAGDVASSRIIPGGGVSPSTDVFDLDLADPASPRLVDHARWSGRLLALLQHADGVRLVTATGLPDLDFERAGTRGPAGRTVGVAAATAHNREVVRRSTAADWLPSVTRGSRTRSSVGCGEVLHPSGADGASAQDTVTVTTWSPGDEPGSGSATALAGAGDVAYSSTDRLYVTSTTPSPLRTPGLHAPLLTGPYAGTTIHAFALTPGGTRYAASGTVAGVVRDRWSLDEHDGRLRVALARTRPDGSPRDNGVVVLEQQGARLVVTGSLLGLGRGEDLRSVRWFDRLAVLVTFRQTDPVHTVDLSDPDRPRSLGELEVPGFSSYLHPVGHDRLLGLGTGADDDGTVRGAQAAVLDVSDPTRTRQVDTLPFGDGTSLDVAEDPHAFVWLPQAEAGVTTLQRWSTDGSAGGPTQLLLRVSPTGELSTEALPSTGGWTRRALPLPDGRVALTGRTVRLVRVG